MSHPQLLRVLYAGVLLCPALLVSTQGVAQQAAVTAQVPHSMISLAPAPRPQGELLARHPGDATFQHAPENYHVFAAATAGRDAGVEALTLKFAGETTLTRIASKNNDFVIEPGGTCHEGNVYSKGDSCTLVVRFNPQGPGHRLGFVNVTHTAEAKPMSFGLTGNGYSPVVSFTPSQITTVTGTATAGTGTINNSTSLAVDGGDIVYIADTGNSAIKEIDSSGGLTTITNAVAQSIAVDSLGVAYIFNVPGATNYFSYYYPWGTYTLYFGPTYVPGSNCTPSSPCALNTVGMSHPSHMSIDSSDNLFFEEGSKGAAEMPVSIISAPGLSPNLRLWYLSVMYTGQTVPFAADANGNLFTAYLNSYASSCLIVEESLYNAEYSPSSIRVAGATGCGFSGDGGQARGARISTNIGQMAFDIAGNLYFADAGNQRVRRIEASTGIINTIAGNGTAGYGGDSGAATSATLSNPTGVAVDSQGQVYILSNAPTAGPTQALRKVGVKGYWNYGSRLKGTPSTPKVFTVSNTGNSALTLSANALFTGASPSDFLVDPATTSCVLTTGATLAAGRSCNIGITFTPTASGARSANLLLLDNTVSGSNVIQLVGTGQSTPTMSITAPSAGSSVKSGTVVTFSVSVTSGASPNPTGTVTFQANGATIGAPVAVNASGNASITFSAPSANTYTLNAIYNGDTNYVSVNKSETLIVTAVKVPVVVTLVPAINPLASCGAVSFAVQVAPVAGSGATGTVELRSGSSSLDSATLKKGSATLSAGGLQAGARSFTATYSGDSQHPPASSTPVSLTVRSSGAGCTGGRAPVMGAGK